MIIRDPARVSCRLFLLLMLAIVPVGCGESPETPSAEIESLPTPSPMLAVTRSPQQTVIPTPTEYSALVTIRARGELRVGILFNYPPFATLAANGQVQGYEADLLRHIAERWGVEVTFVQVTRQTRLPMLYDDEVDLLAGAVTHRRELESFVEFTQTIFQSGYIILVNEDSGVESFGDLSTIVVVEQGAAEAATERAVQIGTSPSINVMNSTEAALLALQETHSAEAIVGRRETLMLLAQSAEGVHILDEFVQVEPYAFAVRRGDTALRDLLNLTLQDMAATSEMGEVFSSSFYGYPADFFTVWRGEAIYNFESLAVTLSNPESVIERMRRGETLRVAGFASGEAASPFDSQPIVDNFNRAVINEMARRWNVPIVELTDTLSVQGLDTVVNGQADLMVGVRPDRSLIGHVGLSQGYYQRGLRLIHMEDVAIGGIGALDFTPVVAVEPLDLSQDLIEDNNGYPQITPIGSSEEAFNLLVGRATYAVVGDNLTLALMAQADTRIEMQSSLYRPGEYAIATPLPDTDFLALVNFTLQDMKADGTLDALIELYFGPYAPVDAPLEPYPMEIWAGDGSALYP